jgi:hypothetical protein
MHSTTSLALGLSCLLGVPFVVSQAIDNSTVPSECLSICAPVVELTNICDASGQNTTSANNTSNQNDMLTDVDMELEKANPMAEMAAGMDGAITMKAGSKKLKRQDMADNMCVCENKSFDVAAIMGLCASCMGINTGSGNKTAVESKFIRLQMFFPTLLTQVVDVDRIMSQCSFSTTSYAPSATSILQGVTVQATGSAASTTATTTGTGMASMEMGAAGRLEVAVGAWSLGMVLASLGLGGGLLFGML